MMLMPGDILILGINGSPHKKGIGARLLRDALKQGEKEGAKTKLIHLVDYEKTFFDGNYTTKVPRELEELFSFIQKADGVILATPVNWFNVSALMKNFIDQLTILELDNFKLEGKVASFIATCEEDGGEQAILEMAGPLNHMGFAIPPYAMFFYNKNFPKKSEHRWMERESKLIGGNVVKMARLIKSSVKAPWDYDKLK